MRFTRLAAIVAWVALAVCGLRAGFAAPPADFPEFIVPGQQAEMDSLRDLFWVHYETAGPQLALWDEWLVNATIWPAVGSGESLDAMRNRWRFALASRALDKDGYVASQQHDGPAHAEGWPFPTWMQAGGVGWHFRPVGVAGYEAPPATSANWVLSNARSENVNDRGWVVALVAPEASVQTPAFSMEARVAPWLRLNWWTASLGTRQCFIEWTTSESPKFGEDRRVYFDTPSSGVTPDAAETRSMIPVYQHPRWRGTITGLRIGFANTNSGQAIIKSFHTASDTRHNVNNLSFIRGCCDYFLWTLDKEFLRQNIGRIRSAMRYVEREFQTRQRKCIYTTWPGHEGRSGVVWSNGKKQLVPGKGVGSNYWDLLPFGGEDALATIYYYDTLKKLANLESAIVAHPEWKVLSDEAFVPKDLRDQATAVKEHFNQRFWNSHTGRFGTIDLDGQMHDYGFTFLNNEAVAFDITTPEHARAIHDWIAGARIVPEDTSTGADIYHWRFGPRSTTLRNIDYYFWGWANPEDVPWGAQVQDGGAVLAWSYYDLMAKLRTAGPDEVARRLEKITNWSREVQAAGGYRSYYGKDGTRGTLQGCGTAGGLGLDCEFVENVLVTQVLLYGLLGFEPTVDGFAISPKLPSTWPELTISRIHLHDQVLKITATRDGAIKILASGQVTAPLKIRAPRGVRLVSAEGIEVHLVPIDGSREVGEENEE